MNGSVIKKPSRSIILIADLDLAVDAFFIIGMIKGPVAGFLAAFVTYMTVTFFLFTIFDVRGNENDL